MAYAVNDLVTIVTPDISLYHFASILPSRFDLLYNYFLENPNSRQVILNVSSSGLQDLFAYTDLGTLPSTVDEWVDLLEAADYLLLVDDYRNPLIQEAINAFYQLYGPTLGEDVIYYSGVMGSIDVNLRNAIEAFTSLRDNAQ